jgi:hypothetical protein
MATAEKAPREVDECRCLLQGMAKNLVDRLYGANGPPWGTPFSALEDTALRLAERFRKNFLDLALSRQADAFLHDCPDSLCLCPSCGQATLPKDPESRLLFGRAAAVEWREPHRYCRKCRKAFFPQSKSLGIDLGHYSTSLLDLVCYAGANKPSFREASLDLDKLGNIDVHEKQVERLSKRIGGERLAERDEQVARFLALPLVERCDGVPAGVEAPTAQQVAVVMADAGMLQLREHAEQAASGQTDRPPSAERPATEHEETQPADAATVGPEADAGFAATASQGNDDEHDEDDPDQDKAPPGRHWHEDKVALVLTMHSPVCETDPCPDIPDTFVDPDRVAKIVRGLKKSAPLKEEETQEATAQEDEQTADAEEGQHGSQEKAEYEGPKLEKRQVVASRQSWPLFGPMVAAAAWLAGFAPAQRKAFVADGARAIWRVWKTRFSSYVPILDFIHAMSYVYAAAKAVGEDPVSGWALYAEWIVWLWQGQVSKVIEKLKEWQKEHGKPDKGEAETSLRSVVNKTLRYLVNNQDKMKYDEYRKQGLPIVSSLVESMVKQISRRVKGTEKFWGEEGAEAILQLRADYLSDGEVMAGFWQRRQAAATGQRSYRCGS